MNDRNGFKLPPGFVPSSVLKTPPGLGVRIHHAPPPPADPIDVALDELVRIMRKAAVGLDQNEPMPVFQRMWCGLVAWPDGWRGGV